jgi:hypothetical protein
LLAQQIQFFFLDLCTILRDESSYVFGRKC